jgi:hypothetical protein
MQSTGIDGPDGSAEHIIGVMHRVQASSAILERVPQVLRDRTDQPSAWTVVDGWGRRLRCMTSGSGRLLERQAVAANGGKPIFVCSGGDGRFGAGNAAAAADNLLIRPTPQRPADHPDEIHLNWPEEQGDAPSPEIE